MIEEYFTDITDRNAIFLTNENKERNNCLTIKFGKTMTHNNQQKFGVEFDLFFFMTLAPISLSLYFIFISIYKIKKHV